VDELELVAVELLVQEGDPEELVPVLLLDDDELDEHDVSAYA